MFDHELLSRLFRMCRWVWNTFFHQVLAVIAIYSIWIPMQNYSNPFSWHVILCTLGYIPLMAQAILLFSGDNVWTQEFDRKTKYWIHGILLTVAAILIIAGTAIEIDRETKIPKVAHFSTIHGVTGLISMIFIIFGLIGGLIAANAQALKGYARPVWYKVTHNLVGQLGYILGIVSLCYGFYTNWFSYYTSAESRLTATIATGLVCLWSLSSAFISGYNQIRRIFNK